MIDKSVILFARVSACNARIEAMKAANIVRLANGEALAFTEHDFAYEANDIERLWREYQ